MGIEWYSFEWGGSSSWGDAGFEMGMEDLKRGDGLIERGDALIEWKNGSEQARVPPLRMPARSQERTRRKRAGMLRSG